MFKMSSLWSATLIAFLSSGGATSAVGAENAIPNLASPGFGWLLQGGIDQGQHVFGCHASPTAHGEIKLDRR